MTTPTNNLPRPNKTGFTLVELLVVISVIMLVLGIAAPSFTK